jgi:hypothetical protein
LAKALSERLGGSGGGRFVDFSGRIERHDANDFGVESFTKAINAATQTRQRSWPHFAEDWGVIPVVHTRPLFDSGCHRASPALKISTSLCQRPTRQRFQRDVLDRLAFLGFALFLTFGGVRFVSGAMFVLDRAFVSAALFASAKAAILAFQRSNSFSSDFLRRQRSSSGVSAQRPRSIRRAFS